MGLARITWVVIALSGAAAVQAQGRLDDVEIVVHPVRDGIYMLEGAGGNIGVSVGEDGILIVDDQFAPLAGKIRAALRGLHDGKVVFVLNTHHHGDHTGGNRAMVEPLARAAMALGAEGLFCETHPDPDRSPSDGANMIPLGEMEEMMRRILAIRQATIDFTCQPH